MFALAVPALAQNTVRGKVTDASGEALPGVNIIVKGSTAGTNTNATGDYTVQVPSSDAVLIFSFIGYNTVEQTVGNQTTIDVKLEVNVKELSEVIVVGYGSQDKRDITGSIVSVSNATLNEVQASNMMNKLKGRVAGVSVVSNGTGPGTQGQIRIRGQRSLSVGNDGLDGPLFVVDGVPYGGLNDINPDDIASMEILKDASATAIYGSRGSGGVILITTKRGKKGSGPVVSYDGSYGVSTPMGKYNVMNGEEYAQFKADSKKYNVVARGTSAYNLTTDELAAQARGTSTDWQDLIYKNGALTNHQIGLQGGSENTQYSMGTGYMNETGIIPNQKFERFTLRANIDQQLGKHVKFGISINNSITYQNNLGGGGVAGNLVRLTPLGEPYNADGTVNLYPANGTIDQLNSINPLTMITKANTALDQTRNLRTFNTAYLEVNLLPGLRYRFITGLNFSQQAFNGYSGPLTYFNTATVQTSSNADIRNAEFWDVNFQHLLYYDKVFAEKHKFGFTGLFETTENHNLQSGFNVKGVPADYIKTGNFALASGAPSVAGNNSFTETGLLSFMGRVNYSFDERYSLTLTMRRDGSSRLSPQNRFINFPAVGANWNVSDESFMKGVPAISSLKFRASWGITASQNVGAYSTLGGLSSGYYNFGPGTAGQQLAYTVTNLPATNLDWQSTGETNLAIDFGVLRNRITGTVEYYDQQTKDILLNVSLPTSNGANSTQRNLGRTESKGLDASLSADIVRNPNGFNFSADVIYYFNRSKVKELDTPETTEILGSGLFVGQPQTVIYDFEKVGIWQMEDSQDGTYLAPVKSSLQSSPIEYPGQIRVLDWNTAGAKKGDANYGVPDGIIGADDRKIIGNFQPKFEGGVTLRFEYKGFDAQIVTYARVGMKAIVPYLTGNAGGGGGFGFFNMGRYNQVKTDYWTDTNPTNAFPAPDAQNSEMWYGSTTGYYDGSFFKARSINAGYTFSSDLIRKAGMSSARLYFSVTNPFIIWSALTKQGLAIDPEGNGTAGGGTTVSSQGGSAPVSNGQIVVNLNNPPVRTFTLGVNLKF